MIVCVKNGVPGYNIDIKILLLDMLSYLPSVCVYDALDPRLFEGVVL